MKVSFDSPVSIPQKGRIVQGEVVHSDESGSLLLLNGLPAKISQKLEVGSRIKGNVSQTAENETVLTLQPEGVENLAPEKLLQSVGISTTDQNLAFLALFRKHGIPLTPELFQKARELFSRFNLAPDSESMNSLGILLSRKSSESAFPLIQKYIQGKLHLGRLFATAGIKNGGIFSGNIEIETFLKKIFSLSESNSDAIKDEDSLPQVLADNLSFQELMSALPDQSREGRLYFQWPFFWNGRDVPDTLEGEAFYSKKGEDEEGISLRILANPPNLGRMEIGIHRLKDSLWVHFSVESRESRELLSEIFTPLSDRLREFGWKSVKVTIGDLLRRENFLSPFAPGPATDESSRRDEATPENGFRKGIDVKA